MRILIIGEDPDIVGGIPRYLLPVASEMAKGGADVHYLWSGGYTGHYDFRMCRHWKVERRDGVVTHGLINAQHVGVNDGHPQLDVQNPDGRYLLRLIADLEPDVIHIHSLIGVPTSVIDSAAEIAPVFLSVHEFGLVCQRRVLVQRDGVACGTYASQSDCAECVDPIALTRYRWGKRLRPVSGALRKSGVWNAARTADEAGRRGIRQVVRQSSEELTGEYRRRLSESVASVNRSVAGVFAVSQHVADVLGEVGVDPDITEVLHIGSASAGSLSPLPLPCRESGVVSFGFLGGVVPNKGVHVLVDALSSMDPAPRVVIAGQGFGKYAEDLIERAPSSISFTGRYKPSALPALLGEFDVVVIPATGPDTSPQTLLEAQATGRPVVASRIGGIPDFVRDGVNGRLVAPGSAEELAAVLTEMTDVDRVLELAQSVRPPKTLSAHVTELMDRYSRPARAAVAEQSA